MSRRDFEQYLIAKGLASLAAMDLGHTRESAMEIAARMLLPDGAVNEDMSVNVHLLDEGTRALTSLAPSFALAWAQCGFPRIEPSHRLAASLMATSMPDEIADQLILPWRCFCVSVPAGLLDHSEHSMLILRAHDGDYKMLSLLPGGLHLGFEPTLSGFADKWIPKDDVDGEHLVHIRQGELALRLALGVIAEMNGHRPSERPSPSAVRKLLSLKDETKLRATTFKLCRSVAVDARQTVADYVSGHSSRVATVRSLVRGHWKQQSCGERGTQRKLIHIEPYWRGDESLPIAVRSHLIDEATR